MLRDGAPLGRLSAREQRIIRERHLGEKSATLKELGLEFGISKERVRQIEKRALSEMRRVLQSRRAYADGGRHP